MFDNKAMDDAFLMYLAFEKQRLEKLKKNPNLGNPKYDYLDIVRFEGYRDSVATGVIAIIDAYGTFEQNEEPSYDIFIKEDNMLVKHVRQSHVLEKVGKAEEIGWD